VRASFRRLVAGISLANYLWLLVGLPLPVPAEKDLSQPFPCQHHHCGCANADQCWERCCCFSQAEKLAWARAHGVAPPEQLVETADQDHSLLAGQASVEHSRPQDRRQRACCHHSGPETNRDTHVARHDCATDESSPAVVVVGLRALECGGNATLWLLLASTLPPPPVMSCDEASGSSTMVCSSDEQFLGVVPTLDSPPPEAARS
jgi:hypothetical protein